MKTKLIIVRHAEAVGNVIREFHGWTDSEITKRGHKQAELVAERLKDEPIDVIYSSTLKRTRQTGEYISKAKGLPILLVDDLKEINGGLWEGMTWKELAEKFPEEYRIWEEKPHLHRMPEGESMEGLQQRTKKAIMDIITTNMGKNICVITHGTVIRTLMCWFKGYDPEDIIKIPWCDNTAVTEAIYKGGKFTLETEGDSSHLDDETSTIKNQAWYVEYKKKFSGIME